MTRERQILLTSVALAIVGWLTATALATSVGASKLRAASAEANAAIWKHQAGKAYSELLKAKAGAGSTAILIPAGARIVCTMRTTLVDDKAVNECEDGTIYPPRNY